LATPPGGNRKAEFVHVDVHDHVQVHVEVDGRNEPDSFLAPFAGVAFDLSGRGSG
jgi:hypothetical protein